MIGNSIVTTREKEKSEPRSSAKGLDDRGVEIHQRQPSYLPTYSGIFSVHAVNFTPSTIQRLTANHLYVDAAGDSNEDAILSTSNVTYVVTTDQSSRDYIDSDANKSLEGFSPNPSSDRTEVNELESENKESSSGERNKIPELTTFPRIQVVTKTITEGSAIASAFTIAKQDGGVTSNNQKINSPNFVSEQRPFTVKDDIQPNDDSTGVGETLLEGPNEGPIEAEAEEESDIFDNLMKTIQNHWLDFVGKMKLSVLDVWKSISNHMMDKLENFATNL